MLNSCDALILSAGWGTRLRPLTIYRPKVAVPVRRKLLLEWWIGALSQCQVKSIFVNVHALGISLKNFLDHLTIPPGVKVQPVFENNILGSGGSLLNILRYTKASCLLVVNGDIFFKSALDILKSLLKSWEGGILMAFSNNSLHNNVVINPNGNIVRFRSQPTRIEKKNGYKSLAYMGMQVVESEILRSVKWDGQFVDLIDMYNSLFEYGYIRSKPFPDSTIWYDIGSVENYFRAHFPNSNDKVYIGKRSYIEPGASVKKSIIWDDVVVKESSILDNCIVLDGITVRGSYHRKIITKHGIYPL